MIIPITLIKKSKVKIEKKLGEIGLKMYELDREKKGAGTKNPVYASLEKKYRALFVRLHCNQKIL